MRLTLITVLVLSGCATTPPQIDQADPIQKALIQYAVDEEAPPAVLSAWVTVVQSDLPLGFHFSPSMACDGGPIQIAHYRAQMEFDIPDTSVAFVIPSASNIRMRVYPVTIEGFTGCADGDTAVTAWSDTLRPAVTGVPVP